MKKDEDWGLVKGFSNKEVIGDFSTNSFIILMDVKVN